MYIIVICKLEPLCRSGVYFKKKYMYLYSHELNIHSSNTYNSDVHAPRAHRASLLNHVVVTSVHLSMGNGHIRPTHFRGVAVREYRQGYDC